MGKQTRYEMRLRIESVAGSPINDYRIKDGHLELRVLTPLGHRYTEKVSRWRTLDDNEVQLHHALGTVVSKWLDVRLGNEPSAVSRAA